MATAVPLLFTLKLFSTLGCGPIAGVFFAFSSLSKWHQSGSIYLLLGSRLYLFGTVGVTMVCNATKSTEPLVCLSSQS
jgi:uncharacterized membrane protein